MEQLSWGNGIRLTLKEQCERIEQTSRKYSIPKVGLILIYLFFVIFSGILGWQIMNEAQHLPWSIGLGAIALGSFVWIAVILEIGSLAFYMIINTKERNYCGLSLAVMAWILQILLIMNMISLTNPPHDLPPFLPNIFTFSSGGLILLGLITFYHLR